MNKKPTTRPNEPPSAEPESQQELAGARRVPGHEAAGNPDRAGADPEGLQNDRWEPGIQAAGSREDAAQAARDAARQAGRDADPLFLASPGEEGPAPNIPSSLNMDRRSSAVRTGRDEMAEQRREHTESSPAVTGGDVDADWASAYSVGDEAPGGDNPTPDQNEVEEMAKAIGVEYEDAEELKGVEKIEERDRNRWELDPASSEDYEERNKDRE